MERRIVEMIFRFAAGDTLAVLGWLAKLGCVVESQGRYQWVVTGLTGMRIGLTPQAPLDLAPVFGLILAGMFWPRAYPALLALTDEEFKRRKKEAASC